MSTFNIGIRKYVEFNEVRYWLLINAKPLDPSESETIGHLNFRKTNFTPSLQFINQTYWKIFILCTTLMNMFSFTFIFFVSGDWIQNIMILVHFNCIIYWIDFIAAVAESIIEKKRKSGIRNRSLRSLVADAISLIPLSLVYIIIAPQPDVLTFIALRYITLLRLYRVLNFFYNYTMYVRNHWKFIIINHGIILYTFTAAFFHYVYNEIEKFSMIKIADWNTTQLNRSIVSWYFSIETVLTVAFGDITPVQTVQRLICVLVALLGSSQMGIITGILTTAFSNSDKRRECYRDDYEATMKILKERKIDKKVLDKISDDILTLWRCKRGFTGTINVQILPTSLQKEIYFDINFGLLNRSLIFSTQPRSFLRSVSLFMKNVSYLPGAIIMEPFGMTDAMLCVASGVIEVVSEENDETVLFSLTSGTIIGEATLFISIPMRCIIRAATYVELQVLMKVNFSRLALKYPDIIRSIRSEIYYRLKFKDYFFRETYSSMDIEFMELSRRKETKKFLQDLRKKKDKGADVKKYRVNAYKSAILSLYVLSENIPAVKTMPITLVRAKPWILRPNTTLTKLWKNFMVLLVLVVAFIYPICAAFKRSIAPELHVFMVFTEVAYITDLYIECTTAIQRKDNFTFITSIREIISHKLKTIGFYLDILATYDISVYANLRWFKHHEHAALLLSLNRVLKIWRIIAYFHELEDNMKSILLLVRTVKYMFFFAVTIAWGAALLYLQACPDNNCKQDRWLGKLEAEEVASLDPTPCTRWPTTLSFYFSAVSISGICYGDVIPTTTGDCQCLLFLLITGVVILIVCMSQTSSTFKHIARVRSNYQSEVFAVDRFMSEHEIPKHLKLEVRNYLQLQWNYDKGFFLMNNGTTEGLPHQQRLIIVTELMKPFLTVPLFRRAGPDFLRVLARSSKVRLLPPNDIITDSGSSHREMFILENGYCEVSAGNETRVIGPVNPFGHYEMILGIPLEIKVRTLTHARIITLNYTSYLRAVTRYQGVKLQIDDRIEKEYAKALKNTFGTFGFRPLEGKEPGGGNVKKQRELLSKQIINVYKYTRSLSHNYWQPFEAWGKLRFFQFFFLPFVIAPNSLFIKIWSSLRIINVILIGVVAPIYFSLSKFMPKLHLVMMSLQVFAGLDMYLMFHVAYYDTRGLLMFHPAKTVVWYLKGTFTIDLLTLFPHFWLIKKAFPPAVDAPSLLYDGLGLIIVLQFYKFIQGCYYLENDILRKSEILKILKFVPLAIIMSNMTTGFLVLMECYGYESSNVTSYKNTNALASEWEKSIHVFCTPKLDARGTIQAQKLVFKMYLITLYWVTQTMTGCGFGDITPHNNTTMIAIIVIIVLGIFLYGYMFADLTSGMITAYVLVTKYRRRIREMSIYVKDKNVDPMLHKRLVLHYEYNWQRTEGAKPQKIFTCVHAALRHSIMASIYEDTVKAAPGFADAEKSILRIIGQHLDEMYFLQGEIIVNYNDVQECIYLLYRGKVELRSQDTQIIKTMGRGGLFGNVSNTPFSRSSVMVVASTNVDVLRLDCKSFFKALQVSPNTKSLLTFLTSEKRDYIVPLTDSAHSSSVHLNLSNLETIPYEITTIRMVRPSVQFPDSNLTALKSSFYFKNSVFKALGRRICTFVILPETGLYNLIEITNIFLAYVSSALTVYTLAFQDTSVAVLATSYILDFMFIIKIALEYHLSYFDKFGDYVIDTKMIGKRYHKSKAIIYDVLSNLPLEIIALAVPGGWKLPALSILRLNRVIRLAIIFEYHTVKLHTLMVNKIYLEFCWILICTTLMIHFFACLWFFVVCPMGECYQPCFVSEMNLLGKGRLELYVVSVYYIVLMVTTVGYSGIPIRSTRELVTSVTLIISCRFAVVLLIGTLAAALNAQSEHLYIYQERISELKRSFANQNLSDYQLEKMWNYVKSLWFFKSGRQIPKFITTAPYSMKCEVMSAMFGHHLSQCYVFSEVDKTFLRQLAVYLRRFVYFPGNYITQQGDIDHTMYFIRKGKVSVLTIHPDLMETIHFTLVENDNFGTVQGLIVGAAHQFSYRAQTEAVILSLTLNHWSHLLKYFPEAEQKIYEKLQVISSEQDRST